MHTPLTPTFPPGPPCCCYFTAATSSALAEKLSVGLSTFLAIWWFPGAFVLTFQGPFTTVGNGYFGSWACFLFAIQWFGVSERDGQQGTGDGVR